MAAIEKEKDTKFCSNCKREIAATNFLMHEVHCKRNIVLCIHCDEPYPRTELDGHIQEYHATVQCPKCHQKMEKSALEGHELHECPERMVKCTYCEIDIPFASVLEHQGYCGTRTEQCPLCERFIMVKDQLKHEDTNCIFPEQKIQNDSNEPAGRRVNTFVLDELSRVMDADVTNTLRNGFTSEQNQRINNDTADRGNYRQSVIVNDTQTRTTREKNTNKKNDPTTNRKRQMRNVNMDFTGDENEKSTDEFHGVYGHMHNGNNVHIERHDTLLDDMLLAIQQDKPVKRHSSSPVLPMVPCDMCQELFPIDLLDQHERVCLQTFGASQSHRVPSPITPNFHNEGTMLPCEFCGEMLLSEDLILHESGCSPASSNLPNNRHSGHDFHETTRREPAVVDNLGYLAAESWLSQPIAAEFRTADDVMLPCEFCDCQFPEDFLIQHQAVCNSNETKTPRVQTPAAGLLTPSSSSVRPKITNRSLDRQRSSPTSYLDYDDDMSSHSQTSLSNHKITNVVIDSSPNISNVSKRRNKGTNLTSLQNTTSNRQRSTAFNRQNSDRSERTDQSSVSVARSHAESPTHIRQTLDDFRRNPIDVPPSPTPKTMNMDRASRGRQNNTQGSRNPKTHNVISRRNSQPEDLLAAGGYEASFASGQGSQRVNKTRSNPLPRVSNNVDNSSRSTERCRAPVKKTNNSRLPRQ